MSEHQESPEVGVREEKEQIEGVIQEETEVRAEQEAAGAEVPARVEEGEEEEKREMIAKEEELEIEEKQKRKTTPKPKIKEEKVSTTSISKQPERQTGNIIRLEKALQPLAKLAKSSGAQSKVLKEVITSAKQLERQLLQIQKQLRGKRL